MTEAVLFDMDGVLTDSEPVINAAAIAGLREYGVDAEPGDFEQFVGMGEDKYIGGVAELNGKTYIPEMKKRVYEIYLEILPGMIEEFPGCRDLLEKLRNRKILMALASSADRIKVEANLKAIGIPLDWFNAIVTGEDVEHKKPAPDSYLCAARKLGVAPDACCVVEDAPSGIISAKNAGTRCVAVEQSFTARELARAEPDVIRAAVGDITFSDLLLD